MNLSEVFAMVEVTTGGAIGVLDTMAKANSDTNPELVAAIHQAIADLANPPAKEAPTTSTKR